MRRLLSDWIEMTMEMLDIFDEAGNCIGQAPRSICHGDPSKLHHTSHVMVFHPDRPALLLQLRKKDKVIQPGKWDTAVGGHLAGGEDFLAGALRELEEELGIHAEPGDLEHLFDAPIRNDIESEDTRVFGLRHRGPFAFQKSEIDEVRFWDFTDLMDPARHTSFTPNLVKELFRLKEQGFLDC